jgi:tRNA threonylcarbamoyladenosine biosynthesis protein TsaB
MALILNIDTATEFASIALCEEGQPLAIVGNNEMRDHASWIHKAIAEILESNGKELKQLCAIAVNCRTRVVHRAQSGNGLCQGTVASS